MKHNDDHDGDDDNSNDDGDDGEHEDYDADNDSDPTWSSEEHGFELRTEIREIIACWLAGWLLAAGWLAGSRPLAPAGC